VLAGIIGLLAIGSILAFPPARNVAAQAVREIEDFVVGMAGGPRGPESYSPPPPFTVKLPGYLPKGFRYVGGEYRPGGNLVSVSEEVIQVPGEEIGDTQTEPGIIDQSVIPSVERDSSEPFIVARYHDRKGGYIEIFERRALAGEKQPSGEKSEIAGQPARLQKRNQELTLTWMDAGTWMELRGTLPEEEMLKVAEGLVIVQKAGELDEGFRLGAYEQFPQDPDYCHPNDGPPIIGGLLLGEVPGQKNLGSVSIDFFDRDHFPETVGGGSNVPNIREEVYLPALKALQDHNLEMQRLPYKSINIFEGTDQGCQTAPEDLQGYLVIEVWENQINVGYGGKGNQFIPRATEALKRVIEDLEK
jgi:hypothetical protein